MLSSGSIFYRLAIVVLIGISCIPFNSKSDDSALPSAFELSRLKTLATGLFLDILQPPYGWPTFSNPTIEQIERDFVQGFAIDVVGGRTFGYCIENEMYRAGNTRPAVWWWGGCSARVNIIGGFFSSDAASGTLKLDFDSLFFTYPVPRAELRIWPHDQSQLIFKAVFHAPVNVEQNGSTSDGVRRKYLAAYYLARFGDQEGINFLLESIRDPNWRSTPSSYFFSAAIRRPEVFLTELISLLSHDDSLMRWRAANALGAIGSQAAIAAPQITEMVKSEPDPFTRRIALEALYSIQGRQSMPKLIEALVTDQEPEVREWAAYYLGRLGDPAANEALLGRIGGQEAVAVQVRSAWAIATIGVVSDSILQRLRDYLLTSIFAEVRGVLAQVHAFLDDRESIPALIGLLQDRGPLVKEGAIISLGYFEAKEAVPYLVSAFDEDENQHLKPAILIALARIGNLSVIPLLESALNDSEFDLFYAAAYSLNIIGRGELAANKNLEKVLSDETISPPLRPVSYYIGDLIFRAIREDRKMAEYYSGLLLERTDNRKLMHRAGGALIALASIYHPGAVSLDALLELARRAEPRARLWALRALSPHPENLSPAVKEALIAGLKDSDFNVRAEALRGLARLFGKSFDLDIIPHVEAATADSEGYVRIRAAEALLDIIHKIEARGQIAAEDAESQDEHFREPFEMSCAPSASPFAEELSPTNSELYEPSSMTADRDGISAYQSRCEMTTTSR